MIKIAISHVIIVIKIAVSHVVPGPDIDHHDAQSILFVLWLDLRKCNELNTLTIVCQPTKPDLKIIKRNSWYKAINLNHETKTFMRGLKVDKSAPDSANWEIACTSVLLSEHKIWHHNNPSFTNYYVLPVLINCFNERSYKCQSKNLYSNVPNFQFPMSHQIHQKSGFCLYYQ